MRILFGTVLVWLYNLFQSHNYFPLLLVTHTGFYFIKLSESLKRNPVFVSRWKLDKNRSSLRSPNFATNLRWMNTVLCQMSRSLHCQNGT